MTASTAARACEIREAVARIIEMGVNVAHA
jgi:hypothetical protein